RAHSRRAATRQNGAPGDRRRLHPRHERDHRLQCVHRAHGGDPLSRGDGAGPGLRHHADHRHRGIDDHRHFRGAHLLPDLVAPPSRHANPERLMIRLFANANYDFIKWRRYAYALTALIIVPGLILLAVKGLNYSIEFTGGTFIQIETRHPIQTAELRADLDAAGIRGAEIQSFGSDTSYAIRARLGENVTSPGGDAEETSAAVGRALDAKIGPAPENYQIAKHEAVGPKVGKELQSKALLAIFFSFFVTLAYLAYRFEWRFGLAAVLATFHDILTTIAFIRYMNLEVSLVVVG